MISVGFIQNGRIYLSNVDCELSDVDLSALSIDTIATMVNWGDFTRFPSTIGEMNKFVKIRNYCNPYSIELKDIKDLKEPTIVFKDDYLKIIIDGKFINPEDIPTEESRREYLERKFINGTRINLEDPNEVGDFEEFVQIIVDNHWGYCNLDICAKNLIGLDYRQMHNFKLNEFAELNGDGLLLVHESEVPTYDGFTETQVDLTLVTKSYFN